MIIPTKPSETKMSPTEFEQFVVSLLRNAIDGVPNAKAQHNEIIKTSDGEYQIDGTIRFEIMGVNYLTLVECKMYKAPVSREKVQVLYDKLRAIGAQKGILATTSYFQTGAIEYAASHGIALVQVIDGKLTYEVRSRDDKPQYYPTSIPKFEGIAQYRISENSIGCSTIMRTKYLSKFIV
jgi:restriction system protein